VGLMLVSVGGGGFTEKDMLLIPFPDELDVMAIG